MRSPFVLASLLLAGLVPGCATTAVATDTSPAWPHASLALDTRAARDADTAQIVERAPLTPTLPSVDRVRTRVAYESAAEPRAGLRVCVTPSGDVASVALEQPSTSPAFDAAVVSDVRAWRFASLPGPASAKSCQRETVVYRR